MIVGSDNREMGIKDVRLKSKRMLLDSEISNLEKIIVKCWVYESEKRYRNELPIYDLEAFKEHKDLNEYSDYVMWGKIDITDIGDVFEVLEILKQK